jgi:hypothetical protein
MAQRYVRSTDGFDFLGGTTWALAKATLTGVAAIDTTTDNIWVSQAHAETTEEAISFAWAGTVGGNQTRVMCASDAAEPPTALATTATVSTTGASNITLTSAAAQYVYFYGIAFQAGSGAVTALIKASGSVDFENCKFILVATGTSSRINIFSGPTHSWALNCSFKFANASQGLSLGATGDNRITGGSILSGGTSPTAFIPSVTAGGSLLVEGFDFSNASSSMNLTAFTVADARIVFRNCKMPASWSGSLNSSTPGNGSMVEMFNCDGADTHYRYRRSTQFGTVQDETTIVRTGGASDGTTTYALKMVSNGSTAWKTHTLNLPEMVKWNDTVGSTVTVTVEFVHDNVSGLGNSNICMDVLYLGTSGAPLGAMASNVLSFVSGTPTTHASSSATWTTTGMTNPNKQKLEVSFTPQEAGFVHVTVRLMTSSYTVYVDPMITLS